MSARALFTLAAAALLAACGQDPDAPVFIYGTAVDSAGAIRVGQPVSLERNEQGICSLPLPARLRAADGQIIDVEWTDFGTQPTGDDGFYVFQLRGVDVTARYRPGTGYSSTCFRAITRTDDGFSLITVTETGADMQFPPLQLPELDAQVSQGAAGITLGAAPLPLLPGIDLEGTWPGSDIPLSSELGGWQLRKGEEGRLWSQTIDDFNHPATLTVPPEVLEDTADAQAALVVIASGVSGDLETLGVGVNFGNNIFPFNAQAERHFTLAAGPGAPVSRGRPCGYDAEVVDPCPLTDGRFIPLMNVDRAGPNPGQVVFPAAIDVRLGTPHPLRSVVIRGLLFAEPAEAVIVEGSSDGGATWTALAELPLPAPPIAPSFNPLALDIGFYAVVPLPAGLPALERVRVRGPGLDLGLGSPPHDALIVGLSQLSLFE